MSADFHHLMLVFTAYIIGAASPGPSTMRIMGVAMQDGKSALCLAASVVSGSLFWGGLAATGISAVLTKYSHVLVVIKVLGGAYLLYLAFKAVRSALKTDEQLAKGSGMPQKSSGLKLYQRGLLMHLTNPKALLGWIATMSLGLGAGASQSTVVIILAACAILSVTIFCGYAIVFSTAPMVRAYQRARRVIEGSLAIVFGAAGFKLLLTRF